MSKIPIPPSKRKKDNKYQLTLAEICEAYGITRYTASKVCDLAIKQSNGKYNIKDVSVLITPEQYKLDTEEREQRILDDDYNQDNGYQNLAPKERLDAIRGDVALEDAIQKKRRNAVECRQLLVALEVENILSKSYKALAISLETLPDNMERDGLIEGKAIDRMIEHIDKIREVMYDNLQLNTSQETIE